MRTLCQRCHQIEGNHPGNFDHMAAPPSAKALAHMAVMERTYDIILPLAKDGRMTCITCHNPHERGVIATGKPSAKGADSRYRERLPGILCIKCHQM
jgi:cytochrome c553